MRSRTHFPSRVQTLSLLTSSCFASALAAHASAQCTLLARETFYLGDRPHGGNGRLRTAFVHDTLKDFWSQAPANGTMWIAGDGTIPNRWAFAASSLDPAEVDPLDPYNGTAFGEPGAAAVLPFSPPTQPFTISAEAVMGPSTVILGLTSSPAVLDNFATAGALWMSLDNNGNWAIRTNGSALVASGQAPIIGTLNSGWLHMELTFDPPNSTVQGQVMGTVIPPTPVTLATPINYLGMEARDNWCVLNNLAVTTGTPLSVSASGPISPVCSASTVSLSATTNAADPRAIFWTRDGLILTDGPSPWGGAMISGSNSLTLTLASVSALDNGTFACAASNACGLRTSNALPLAVVTCCVADVDDGSATGTPDGGVTIDDLLYYLAIFEAGSTRADVDDGSSSGTPDGGVTIDDLLYFLARFESGC